MDKINPGFDIVMPSIVSAFVGRGVVSLKNVLLPSVIVDSARAVWKKRYEPQKFSYSVAKAPSWKLELKDFVSRIAQTDFDWAVCEWRRFDERDYTLLFDSLKPHEGVVLFLDVANIPQEWGGYSSFVGDGEVMRVVAEANTLTVINAKGLREFTKRLNHNAKNPRVFLYGVLK